MPTLRDVIAGPWRAVLVLGVTEILAWGAIFYPPVLTVPLIADERGWSMSFAMGGFSLALLTAGLVSPRVGLLIDRYGGHRVMSVGSLLAALGLALIVYAAHPAAYLAVWMLLGVATAATLYDPAFATLGRACPRICSPSSPAPASMRRRWWRSARCSGRRRSRRAFASSWSRAASTRFLSRASRSQCCWRLSRCSRCSDSALRPPPRSR